MRQKTLLDIMNQMQRKIDEVLKEGREVRKNIKTNEDVSIVRLSSKNSNSKNLELELDIVEVVQELIKLSEIEIFKDNIVAFENIILNKSLYEASRLDTILINKSKIDKTIEILEVILEKVKKYITILNSTVQSYDEYKNIYSIKLPKYENFSDIADFTKKMDYVFSTVFKGKNKAKFVGFDVGSEWYLVALETLADYNLFSLFMLQVYHFTKRKINDDQTIKQLESETDEKLKEECLSTIKELNSKILEISAKKICSDAQQSRDVEDITKLAKSIETMAELVIKGTEVHKDKEEKNDNEKSIDLPKIEVIKNLLENYQKVLEDKQGESLENDEEE